MKKIRLLLIGLDGASWNVLKPLIEQDALPTIRRLMEEGCYGDLRSTIPPITGPAWVSLATGMNPGKTGVFDFLNRRIGTYELEMTTSKDFQQRAFWDVLSRYGKRVGIVNFPLLYPPYEINGFMISGFGGLKQFGITYPPAYNKIIDKIANGYEIDIDVTAEKYMNPHLLLADINRILEKRLKVIYHLLEEKQYDVFVAIFQCTDWIQHFMWKYIAPDYRWYDTKHAREYYQRFVDFWRKIDRAIDHILKIIGRETIVFVISDHGFGPCRGCFNIMEWLCKKGYLTTKRASIIMNMLRKIVISVGRLVLKTPLKHIVPRRLVDKGSHTFNKMRKRMTAQIDFRRSRAYILGHTVSFGCVYLNVRGRDPHGTVTPGDEYNRLRDEIAEQLRNVDRELQKNVRIQIFYPDSIYDGKKVQRAPDIIFSVNNWEGVVIKEFTGFIYSDAPFRYSGHHKLNGIFIASGPHIRRGQILNGLNILDIAPTVLHIMNVPIPRYIDGRVAIEIFAAGSPLSKHQPGERERIRHVVRILKDRRII